ncbi:MAG TPA: PspC domain-containing protein [Clostridia bacterium]|nr:PspC domain-containing protein [Clostridia bacterium]
MKKLYKTRENKKICGVCNGLAEYLEIDVSLVRLLWVLWGCFGVGIIAYFAAAIILPYKE